MQKFAHKIGMASGEIEFDDTVKIKDSITYAKQLQPTIANYSTMR